MKAICINVNTRVVIVIILVCITCTLKCYTSIQYSNIKAAVADDVVYNSDKNKSNYKLYVWSTCIYRSYNLQKFKYIATYNILYYTDDLYATAYYN